MAKTVSEIVDRALTLIDEVPTSFNTAATTETSIRETAIEILPEVCRDLVKELPWDLKRYLAESASLTVDTLSDGESQADYVKRKVAFIAPNDFWELVSIRLTVWAKTVTNYIYINGEEYSKQNNPFTRGGKQNPVVALSNTKIGSNKRIECFSVNENDPITVEVFEYISFDRVPTEYGQTWPDELFDEVTKALATELHIIKSRIEEAVIKGEEVKNAIEQHE
jgi:hypothetical protein